MCSLKLKVGRNVLREIRFLYSNKATVFQLKKEKKYFVSSENEKLSLVQKLPSGKIWGTLEKMIKSIK